MAIIKGDDGANNLKGTDNVFDVLKGYGGNDTLDGGAGPDRMVGGADSDTYVVDDNGDIVIEKRGDAASMDLVLLRIPTLARLSPYVENLTLEGGAENASGNTHGNLITGNDFTNILNGRRGIDFIWTEAGLDKIVFDTPLRKAKGGLNFDYIFDFSPEDDTIWLDPGVFRGLAPGILPAEEFEIGVQATDARHRVIYDPSSGALSFDQDGDGDAHQPLIFAFLDPNLLITSLDFSVGKMEDIVL